MAPVSQVVKEDKVREPHSTAAQILDVARELFGEDGYDATSMAEIARRVGVVEGAVYRHFSSKRDLLHHVIRSFYEPLIESAVAGVAAIESPRERVRFLIRRQLDAMAHDPLLCRLIISEARSFDDYYESEVAQLSRRYTSLFVQAYRDGVRRGLFRDDVPPEMVRDMVYGSIEHLAWSAVSGHRIIDQDTTTDQLLSVVCCGIDRSPGRADGSLDADLRKLETVAARLDEMSAALRPAVEGRR
jgi:AcrR family transcriptional regulator